MAPMTRKPVVPDQHLAQYNRFSLDDFTAFWKYAFKKRRIGLVLYPALCIAILICYYQLVQRFAGSVLSVEAWVVSVLTIGLYALIFTYLPSMPREYMYRFKGKLRQDLPADELRRLLMDHLAKSMEQASVILAAILLAGVSVYRAAQSLAMPDFWAWALVIGAGANIYLISLILVSLGKYSRENLSKVFIDEESKRYTSIGNYKKLLAVLGILDLTGLAILAVYLFMGL